MSSKKVEGSSSPAIRRDPYEVLSVARDANDQEIKSAYRKLALKYHPDKNANNPEASELFKEVAYSYSILSDPEKRRQYDNAGFEESSGLNLKVDHKYHRAHSGGTGGVKRLDGGHLSFLKLRRRAKKFLKSDSNYTQCVLDIDYASK